MEETKYRFYTCEIKARSWECQAGDKFLTTVMATQLIPIESWVPKFMDPLILSYMLQKPVTIKPRTS